MRAKARLSNADTGTQAVIDSFDIGQEVIRIFARKAGAGRGAHSDFCWLQGRTINDWLATPERMAVLLAALEMAGWVKRGHPPQDSRFWCLLQGPRAETFGAFSPYELQVIHDWIRGPSTRPLGAPPRCRAKTRTSWTWICGRSTKPGLTWTLQENTTCWFT